MSKEMTKQELIDELSQIGSLYDSRVGVEAKMESILEKAKLDEKAEYAHTVEVMRKFETEQKEKFSALDPCIDPRCFTPPPARPDNIQIGTLLLGAASGILMILGIIIIFAGVVLLGEYTLTAILGLALIVFWYVIGRRLMNNFEDWLVKYTEWKTLYGQWEKDVNAGTTKEATKAFFEAWRDYDACFLAMTQLCDEKFAEEFDKVNKATDAVKKKAVAAYKEAEKEHEALDAELAKVTLIDSDYFVIADRIAAALKRGRADTLKEAINIVLDDVRKEQAEEARREEARRREAIMEKEAEEERRHNDAMRRQAEEDARAQREHNARMEREAAAQTRAAERAADEQRRAADAQRRQSQEQERAAMEKCRKCANSTKCSYAVKKNSLSCGAYRPR
ncbi:MAG: hypothetical protein IJV96_07730 [Clostridia bacterium]|nr:hypothetical protein [Clostridia bacterium]